MKTLLFVYGTLRPGLWNNVLLQNADARYVGEGYINGVLMNLGGIPGVKLIDTDKHVHGDVYEVGEGTLQRCDHLEGYNPAREHDSMYLRRTTTCWFLDGEDFRRENVNVYEWNDEDINFPVIEGGDYIKYKETQTHVSFKRRT